jgi:multisite-specific tRNA:(cytosine-C5)-methyltransferase
VIEKINMENDRFSAYYKAQKIVPEEEWDTFIDALRQHLPTTFRVAGSRQYVSHIIIVNHRLQLCALEQPTS